MIKGFRDFILRGNVIDLAVGIIIGAAFGAVVTALVERVLMPLIGLAVGTPNFDNVACFATDAVTGACTGSFGALLTAIVNFLLIAFAVYFFLVVPMNRLMPKKEAPPAGPTTEEKLLMEIRDAIKQSR
jgi:large conductance mechanosensitive channel